MPFVVNQGVRIHYEVEGSGFPVVLMHGFAGDLQGWYESGYVKELSSEYELILVDARGHGGSDKPHAPEAYYLGLMVGDILSVLDDQGISRASFFGYSMGGRIGFSIPLYAPNRFSSLILGGATYPIHGDEDAKDELRIRLAHVLDKAIRESPDNPMAAYITLMERSSGQQFSPARRTRVLSNDALALQAVNLALWRAVSSKADKALPLFTMPCLLFVGEADPRYLWTKECASRMPNASFISFPGLNHGQGLARIDLVLPHVKRFLSSVLRKDD